MMPRPLGIAGLLLIAVCVVVAGETSAEQSPSVGREGRLEAVLPRGDLQPQPVVGRPTLILRIAGRAPVSDGFRYDLRFQGAVPGAFDLSRYLLLPDGSHATDLPALPVNVRGVLPADHQGSLSEVPSTAISLLGGYRVVMILLFLIWLGLLPFLLRRRRRAPPPAPTVAPPTVAEQLAPLVALAQAGALDSSGLAQLERLLIACWRERLGLGALDMRAALARLRADPQAGALLRQVDQWLHQRPGTQTAVDLVALLAPYQHRAGPPANVPAQVRGPTAQAVTP